MSRWPSDAGPILSWSNVQNDIWHYSRPEYSAIDIWQISENPGGSSALILYEKDDYGHLLPSYSFKDPDQSKDVRSIACIYGIISDRDMQNSIDREFVGEIGDGSDVLLYGSIIGPGIDDNPFKLDVQEFVLMDIMMGNAWLAQDLVSHYAKMFSLRRPYSFLGRASKAIHRLRTDDISSEFPYEHSGMLVPVSGFILRPLVELNNSSGQRVIASISRKQPGVVS